MSQNVRGMFVIFVDIRGEWEKCSWDFRGCSCEFVEGGQRGQISQFFTPLNIFHSFSRFSQFACFCRAFAHFGLNFADAC